MKVVVIALLIASCFAAEQLTPRTQLPSNFDDMVFNTLGGLGNLVPAKNVETVVSQPLLKVFDPKSITSFISRQLPWVNDHSLDQIVKSCASVDAVKIATH